jgi:flagellar protein FliS
MALTITSETYRDELLQASPSRMVVMCYDETLQALETAMDAIERGDIEGRFNAVAVATELLCTLFLCLDMEKGGDIAENLGRIYEYILKSLPRINLYDDAEPAEQAIRLLAPLRESWLELDGRSDDDTLTTLVDRAAVESARADGRPQGNGGIV